MLEFNLTANRSDEEPWRVARLHRVIGWIAASSFGTLARLDGLHDHKGDLTATWNHRPWDVDRAAVEQAWSSRMGTGDARALRRHAVSRDLMTPLRPYRPAVAWTSMDAPQGDERDLSAPLALAAWRGVRLGRRAFAVPMPWVEIGVIVGAVSGVALWVAWGMW